MGERRIQFAFNAWHVEVVGELRCESVEVKRPVAFLGVCKALRWNGENVSGAVHGELLWKLWDRRPNMAIKMQITYDGGLLCF